MNSNKTKTSFVRLVFLICIILSLDCENDLPTQPTELFELEITEPHDSSTIFQSLRIKLNTSDSINNLQAKFYVDNFGTSSVMVSKDVFYVDISRWSDDSLHTINAMGFDGNGKIGYSNQIIVRIRKSAKYYVSVAEPIDQQIIRDTNSVKFSWLRASNFSNSTLEISKNQSFTDLVFAGVVPGSTFNSPSLNAGSYYWRLKVSFSDSSIFSLGETRTFSIAGPLPPLNISPSDREITNPQNQLAFIWTSSIHSKSYQIEITKAKDNTIVYTDSSLTDTLFIKNLPLGSYKWKVRGKNKANIWGDWSPNTEFGNGVFQKILDIGVLLNPVKIKKTSNGDFLILCNGMQISDYSYLIKTDELGSVLWYKRFDYTHLVSFKLLYDDNIILAGSDFHPGPQILWNTKVIKLDNSGNILFEKIYSTTNDEYLLDICTVPSGFFACGMKRNSQSVSGKPILLKISDQGDLESRNEWDENEASILSLYNIGVELVGFGYKKVGNSSVSVFLKFNLLGNKIFEKNYNEYFNINTSLIENNNEFVFVGKSNSIAGMSIKRIDSNGEVLMENSFPISNLNSLYDVIKTQNSDYIATGYNNKYGSEQGVYAIKLGNDGSFKSENFYKGNRGCSLSLTQDGGILFLGGTSTNTNVVLIKTNLDGDTFYP